jgi:hypothetical protein
MKKKGTGRVPIPFFFPGVIEADIGDWLFGHAVLHRMAEQRLATNSPTSAAN